MIETLTFGVEFENYLPEGTTHQNQAAALAVRLGETVNFEGYNHTTRPSWKVVTDGSLGDYRRGSEVVSPILMGDGGIEQVEKVCEAAQDFGSTVTRACGLHVHVGARTEPLAFFKKLIRLYQTFEPVIDAMMPASRRASLNPYCRSLGAVPVTEIEAATSLSDLSRRIARATRADARYHKVNLESHGRHGTVEFRQHSGTLDARKTKMWVRMCLRMVEAAKGDINFGSGAGPRNSARYGSKAWRVGQMLLRAEGATGPEICAELGWPSVSVPAQARACGLDVYTQRTGRVVRYFVRQAPEAPAIDVSLEGFCNLIKASDEERAYMRTRTANLAGNVSWAA